MNKKRTGTTLVMVSIISAINLMGINYAQWNDGIKETTNIKTGNIEAKVDSLIISGDGLQGTQNDSKVNISGSMQQGQTATVEYSVDNKGTLPVKFKTPKVKETNGLKFNLSSAVKDIDPKNGGNGQFEMTACEAGDYHFTVELPYSLDVQ